MKYLKFVILAYALLYVIGGVFLFEQRKSAWDWYFIIYLFLNAFVIILGTFFERSRYKAKHTSEKGWIKTNEKFVDPKTGKVVEVDFHPQTGERKYRESK